MSELKNWYFSKTVWGAAIAILASCANLLGWEISTGDQYDLTEKFTAIAAAAGGILAIWGPDFGQQAIAMICCEMPLRLTFICHSDWIGY